MDKERAERFIFGNFRLIFNPDINKPQHVLLNLHQIDHPHTGKMIANKVNGSLVMWEIPRGKILLLITDNGSNMKKALHELNNGMESCLLSENDDDDDIMNHAENEQQELSDSEAGNQVHEAHADNDNDRSEQEAIEELNTQGICSLSCLAHTMQLIVKDGLVDTAEQKLLTQCRKIVKKVRVSSTGTQELVKTGEKD